MRSWMIAFSLGVILGGFIPSLPTYPQIFLFLIVPILSVRFELFRLVSAFFIGLFWFLLWAELGMQKVIPQELEGEDIWVTGKIISLPQQAQHSQRFEFLTSETQQKFLLNDYDNLPLKPNQKWQLKVRLKRPHGFSNPGGFDYEGWLFQKSINATGYIRSDPNNHLLEEADSLLSFESFRYSFSQGLKEKFPQHSFKNTGLLKALSIGDRYQVSDEEWALFTATGTNHLIVISGLHVGLVAAIIYRLSIFLFSFSSTMLLRIPAPQIASVTTILATFIYAGLAGFSLPAIRAFVMVAVFMLGQCLSRQTSVINTFCLALGVVLFVDPLAPQSSGFWLSFGAVAVLIYFGSKERNKLGDLSILQKFILLVKTQTFLFIGLLPLMLLFFHQVSWLAPLVNLVAIPFISLLVVPLCLLSLLFLSWIPALAFVFLLLADFLLSIFKLCLEYFVSISSEPLLILPSLSGIFYWLLITGSVGLICLPFKTKKQKVFKLFSLLLFMPLLIPSKTNLKSAEFVIDILDVGQGLALVISTQNHHLIYDAGPEYSPRFNAGNGLLLPFLQAKSISNIDTIIVSHGDNDHAGGLPALLAQFPEVQYFSSDVSLFPSDIEGAKCKAGQLWQWDEVQFEILHPDEVSYDSNNSSCVLLVTAGTYSALLSGDIESRVERKLVRNNTAKLEANILIAPHHGSQTSSITAFIEAVSPQYVVFSSGYLNRFKHPHPKIRARYESFGVQTFDTAHTGAMSFKVSRDFGVSAPENYRNIRRRYWSSYK